MNKTIPVFVYGTLLEGFQNHDCYVRPYQHKAIAATIRGAIYHLPQGYPGLVEGTEDVVGALLFFAQHEYEAALSGLDELETYFGPDDPRNEYERMEVTAWIAESNEAVTAYVYRYLDEEYVRREGIRVQDGDWRGYLLARGAE
ncbi:gamma-glutamylcyclotransferase family protein [Brevibacillus choshinensis]|uniref:Gamma-glutamylcyclotransferase n=1 Tax=Brevibacillus choshinensis TaxID=54911 RepID=A0ABX7FM59_BRECH|nr:gamma-glutamylcyclotransferase [Brevibacillus choshinensis]QRG66085.1 gamma-glutamylcyclotransferase [Brevibacillus choshinensis]